MGGLAGLVRFGDVTIAASEIDEMMDLIRHRGPDGIAIAIKDACAFGQARLALRKVELDAPFVLKNSSGRYVITSDSRLYNRGELLQALDLEPLLDEKSPDSAILLAAYKKWGKSMLDRLDGDFSFAIFDAQEDSVFIARDPFGVKPLFYHWQPGLLIFGSEPKQILTRPEISSTPDDMIVGEFLFMNFQDNRRTFYQDVARLRPAHYLVVTATEATECRYWNPVPEKDTECRTKQDYLDTFRALFKEAVRKRLNTDWPVVSQLSGGFDSSSIVVVAGEIYREGDSSLPGFSTVSAVFDDLECDESEYSSAVSESVPFESESFNPIKEDPTSLLLDDIWQLDSPFTDIQRGTFINTARHINERQGRLLLTGLGGDELTHEEYYLRDLASNGKYWLLCKEAWKGSKKSWNSFPYLVMDALRYKVPPFVKNIYRKLKRSSWTYPAWATSEFIDYFKNCPVPPPEVDSGYPTMTQNAVIQFMNFPANCWALEAIEASSAYRGFEVSHPFLDRKLTEFVANIPLEMRLPDGQWKYLLAASLTGLLPEKVCDRLRKTRFDSFNRAVYCKYKHKLDDLIDLKSAFDSNYYINKDNFFSTYNSSENHGGDYSQYEDKMWRIINIELWLCNKDSFYLKNLITENMSNG
jgi:asparagine synthase (glutamine-hydrolysing)